MIRQPSRRSRRHGRHLRLRQKISGTAERPRMAVGISNRHMYVQFIDDTKAAVLASVSTLSVDAELKKNVKGAQALGRRAGEIAKEKGIQTVVFDRGGRLFHGRVKAIAEGARETGLKF